MEKKFIVEITEETANYLQRLGNDLESRVFLIDRLFANHASDTDTALFDSEPFKHYTKKYEEAFTEFELAKQEFQKTYLEPIVKEKTGLENPTFNWKIDDYLSHECEVTLID